MHEPAYFEDLFSDPKRQENKVCNAFDNRNNRENVKINLMENVTFKQVPA